MDTVSVNQFQDTLKDCVGKVISQQTPLKVIRANGADFVVVSAEDWEREQETLICVTKQQLDATNFSIHDDTYPGQRVYTHR
jgi:antitoxin YefM